MVQVTGTLTSPIGVGYNKASIRITALENNTVTIGSFAKIITGSDGSYDFTLTNGSYSIEVLYPSGKKMWYLPAEVEVTDNTTSILTLEELTGYPYVCEE